MSFCVGIYQPPPMTMADLEPNPGPPQSVTDVLPPQVPPFHPVQSTVSQLSNATPQTNPQKDVKNPGTQLHATSYGMLFLPQMNINHDYYDHSMEDVEPAAVSSESVTPVPWMPIAPRTFKQTSSQKIGPKTCQSTLKWHHCHCSTPFYTTWHDESMMAVHPHNEISPASSNASTHHTYKIQRKNKHCNKKYITNNAKGRIYPMELQPKTISWNQHVLCTAITNPHDKLSMPDPPPC